jgi:hypothetical protein
MVLEKRDARLGLGGYKVKLGSSAHTHKAVSFLLE